MLIPHLGDKKNQTLMLAGQRTSSTSKIHAELIVKSRQIWKKVKMFSTFIPFLGSLSLLESEAG